MIRFLLIEVAQLPLNRLNLVHIARWLLKLEADLDEARLAKYHVVLGTVVLKVAVNARQMRLLRACCRSKRILGLLHHHVKVALRCVSGVPHVVYSSTCCRSMHDAAVLVLVGALAAPDLDQV